MLEGLPCSARNHREEQQELWLETAADNVLSWATTYNTSHCAFLKSFQDEPLALTAIFDSQKGKNKCLLLSIPPTGNTAA